MFKINLIEGIKNIDKNKTITYLSVLLFTLLFLLQSYTYSYHVVNNFQKEVIGHETIKNYQLYRIGGGSRIPFFLLEDYDPDVFDGIDIEKETVEFYETIANAQYVKFSCSKPGGIIIENFKGDPAIFKSDEYFDDDDGLFYVHALYTYPNFHKVENYRVIKGRDFTDEDMIFIEGGTRPVLLGYKYLNVYEVGDILSLHRENNNNIELSSVIPKIEVIGFLEEDTTVIDEQGTDIYDLDRCIVFPKYSLSLAEYENSSKSVRFNACNTSYLYFLSFTKFLIDTEYEIEAVAELQDALNNYEGISKHYTIVRKDQAIEKMHTRTETFTNFAMMITGVLMTFAVFTVLFSVVNRIENNLKDYAIHISIGASSNNVIGFVISETVIILSCSVALGLIFSKWLMAELYMPYYFIEFLGIFAVTSLLIILLSAITAKLALKKYDLCALIK